MRACKGAFSALHVKGNAACPYPYRPVVRVSDKVVDALLAPRFEVYVCYLSGKSSA